MITTDYAIELLKRVRGGDLFTPGWDTLEAFDMAIIALEQQEKDRWIPVTERLPEKDKYYKVTVKSEGLSPFVDECYWNGDDKVFERWDDYSDTLIQMSGVVAWKPLPEPYQEDEA